jgi:hypothetical protein
MDKSELAAKLAAAIAAKSEVLKRDMWRLFREGKKPNG